MRPTPEELQMLERIGRDPSLIAFMQRTYQETLEQLMACEDSRYGLLQGKARTLNQLLTLLRGDSSRPAAQPRKAL